MPAYDFANVMAEMGDFDSWGLKIAIMPTNVDKKVCTLRLSPSIVLSFGSNFERR
jgi:hypothetical protein